MRRRYEGALCDIVIDTSLIPNKRSGSKASYINLPDPHGRSKDYAKTGRAVSAARTVKKTVTVPATPWDKPKGQNK